MGPGGSVFVRICAYLCVSVAKGNIVSFSAPIKCYCLPPHASIQQGQHRKQPVMEQKHFLCSLQKYVDTRKKHSLLPDCWIFNSWRLSSKYWYLAAGIRGGIVAWQLLMFFFKWWCFGSAFFAVPKGGIRMQMLCNLFRCWKHTDWHVFVKDTLCMGRRIHYRAKSMWTWKYYCQEQ